MKRFLGKLAAALCLLLAGWPALALLAAAAGLPGFGWTLYPALACLLAAAVMGIRGKPRAYVGILGLLLTLLGAFAALPTPARWFLPPLCAALYWIVLRKASLPPFEEWPMTVWVGGLGMHLLALLIARGASGPLHALFPALRTLLLCYLPVFLWITNHLSLLTGASGPAQDKLPYRILRGNRWMVGALAALLLAIANFGAVRDAFYAVAAWAGRGIARVLLWLSSLLAFEVTETGALPAGEGMMPGMPIAEGGGPSWLERAAVVLTMLLCAALVAYGLYRLGRLLARLIRLLAARMRLAARQLGEGVEDRTERILTREEVQRAIRSRADGLRRRIRRARPAPKDARAEVRFAYAGWRARRTHPASETARESLRRLPDGEAYAALYERARYSELPVTDADAARMRQLARED